MPQYNRQNSVIRKERAARSCWQSSASSVLVLENCPFLSCPKRDTLHSVGSLSSFLFCLANIVCILPSSPGCFCTFSDGASFEYIRNSLEVTLLSNLAQEDRLPFQGLPLVIVFAPEADLTDKDIANLRQEGQALAER